MLEINNIVRHLSIISSIILDKKNKTAINRLINQGEIHSKLNTVSEHLEKKSEILEWARKSNSLVLETKSI
jgi:hypothetical protein